ncbi:MAG: 4-hydroxybenzoate 3-monooxygenase [Acidimicrobiales bacterium]
MKTQVAIVGAGPAGSLLSELLHAAGVDNVVLERQTKDYVLSRIRAGVLESGTVEILRNANVSERLDREGTVHETVNIAWRGEELLSIETAPLCGRDMMGYGQTAIQEDLYEALDRRSAPPVFEAVDVELHDIESATPWVTFTKDGIAERVDCDYIVGCDGFHGVSRQSIPAELRTEYEKEYPFGWIGILSETPPLPILMYANHERGFGLCSMRNPMLSRYYVQCPLTDKVEEWSDDRFWEELLIRLPEAQRSQIVTGPSIEKSIAPLRSFVSEPMQYGSLFLAGDAAHIVPPTGAKGLNLAMSDIHYLSQALLERYGTGSTAGLEGYGATALARVWGAVRFSWWLTSLLHRFPNQTAFDQRAQEQELAYLSSSTAAQTSLAEQYVGFPL